MLDSSLGICEKDLDLFFEPIKNLNHIALAVSGGLDSLALMLMVSYWAKTQQNPPKITVFSVNHGLRDEAIFECEFVKKEAKKLNFNAQVLTWEGVKPKAALQENARKARYELIGQAMIKKDIKILLTAHHAFDQAETILMRMAHGSGIKGLIGMDRFSDIENVKIFRPLLEITPDKLAKIVKAAGMKPMSDPSNFDENYERVRWRKMLPALFKLGLNEVRLNKFSYRLKRANIALDEITNKFMGEKVEIDNFGIAKILKSELSEMAQELQIRLIQKLLQKIGAKQKPFALSQIEKLVEELTSENFKKQTLHGCIIERKNNYIIIAREVSKIPIKEIKLAKKEEIIWDNRFVIKNNSKHNDYLVSLGLNLSKKDYQDLFSDKMPSNFVQMPTVMQMQAAPVVFNKEGNIIFIGKFTINERLSKDLEVKII